MFEHFGVLDIWSGIKKYKNIVSIVFLSVTVFFIGLNIFKINGLNRNIHKPPEHIYMHSLSYYVEPKTDISVKLDLNVYSSLPDNYIAMLDTDLCRQYIYDKLTSLYPNKYIIENSGIDSDTDVLDINLMKELYMVKKVSKASIIELSSMTYSKELSKAVVSILNEFLNSYVSNKISISCLKMSGEIDKTIKYSDIASENIDSNDKRKIVRPSIKVKYSLTSFIKDTVVPITLAVILCIGVIVFIGLINPTLNRASDFSEYDVPIIGEIKNFKNFKEIN